MICNTSYNVIKYNIRYILFRIIPICFYPVVLNFFYKKRFSRTLDLRNPKRLSEKILWSILYDKNPMKTILSDRLKAKDYVKNLIPSLKVAEVYQVASCFDDIDFNKAPKTFVIKTNHAWKSHILVEDKNDITKEKYKKIQKYYKKVLGINYAYWGTPELQYKNIKPRVYLEEYLHSKHEKSYIHEYEVYCLNSKVEFINYIISYSGAINVDNCNKDLMKSRVFYPSWEFADFNIRFCDNISAPKSENKNKVLNYAEMLAIGFDFVRIDFFEVENQLYFGEFTFSPYSGFMEFSPDIYDLFYGDKW